MKSIQAYVRVGLLCALIVVFFNCKKESTNIVPPAWKYSTFTDARDGKVYKYIKIGTQEWMAENLAYKTASGSWFSYDSDIVGAKIGRLYTWDAAKQAVPAGWHLPTDEEWKKLEMSLGMSPIDADATDFRGKLEGAKLKSASEWSEDGNGTDAVGFSALPGGFRSSSGDFFVFEWQGYWWTATESDTNYAWYRMIKYNDSRVNRNDSFKGEAYSVRCIKD